MPTTDQTHFYCVYYSRVCLFGRFERDLYDLRRSIALAEFLDVLHGTELQQYLIQLFESDAARHIADHYLVGAETRPERSGLNLIGRPTCAA